MNKEDLKDQFEKLNLLKEKYAIQKEKFYQEILSSDCDTYLDSHLNFLTKANKHFREELHFKFINRKDKEKVFYFLKEKLNHKISIKLRKIAEKLIEEIDFKSLEEYKTWINQIKRGQRDDEMKFTYSIMKSQFVEYHYDLMKDEVLSHNFRRSLRNRFEEHKEKGESLLLL